MLGQAALTLRMELSPSYAYAQALTPDVTVLKMDL